MSRPINVLVLEDDPFISLDLETIVTDLMSANVVVSSSVAKAQMALNDNIDLALLDVDVEDGTSFPIAAALHSRRTPFIFVSGSMPNRVPFQLRNAPFVTKPYEPRDIQKVIRSSLKSTESNGASGAE